MSLMSWFRGIRDRTSLTIKLVGLTVVLGTVLLFALDRVNTDNLERDFSANLIASLEQEATNDRFRLHKYIKTQHQAAKLLASQASLMGYLDLKDPRIGRKEMAVHRDTPPWLPDRSALGFFAPLRFVLLLDGSGRVVEAYDPFDTPIPIELLNISPYLLEISSGQSYLTAFENVPYIVSSEKIPDAGGRARATLVLVSPIDDLFLESILETPTAGHEIALMTTGDNQRIIASSDSGPLPPGMPFKTITDEYLITSKEFFDYGSSSLEFRFVSLIPKARIDALAKTAIGSARSQYLMMTGAYLLAVMLLVGYFTRSIKLLTRHVVAFQKNVLGSTGQGREYGLESGDELKILNRHFHSLMDEVVQSHEVIRREAAEEMRLIVRSAFDAVIATNSGGEITTWNPAAAKLFGWDAEEVRGRKLTEVILRPEDRGSIEAGFADVLSAGWSEAFNRPMELTVVGKDGSALLAEATFTYAQSGRDYVFIGIIRDITERKRIEEQLVQAQKMESVGRLAGGIAHDFNNILSAIIGYAEMVFSNMKEDDPNRKDVGIILKAGTSAAELVSQLLAFSRKQIISPKVLSLNQVINNLDKILMKLLSESIEKEMRLDDGLWNIKADASQIEQVLVNLTVNARDAITGNGRLYIETSNVVLDEDYVKSHFDIQPGQYVMLTVSDTGSGMTEEQLRHIFEPFYSTKEKGKGTGLGLATVFGIVKQIGGDVHAYSEPGIGSTFKIYFPRATEALEEAAASSVEKSEGGAETLLLVEDDEDVRGMVVESLSRLGYTVIEATNGEDALAIHSRYHGNIHLLLTDVIMPKINGVDLARRLKEIDPDMKVIFMSGYTENSIAHRGILDKDVNFIQKPVSPKKLARVVRSVLSGR